MAHAISDPSFDDPELRRSLRIIRQQRTLKLVGVGIALVAATSVAIAYASLSYSDHNEAVPAHMR
jgi:hypothetical protein